ncbi:MAG: tRNA pseudouridine(55) synthase TruB [Tepidiformaceae bacterium]
MGRPSASNLNGILVIDKPAGWTSHDVVAKARGITRQRRIGHTGTLDPMATGVLVLCLGQATRLVEYMIRHEKRYVGEITLGVATDTDDAEGEVLSRKPPPSLTQQRLRSIESAFTGDLLQRPPAYSAIKVDGKRSYARARGGEAVELPLRPVVIREISMSVVEPDRLRLQVRCGPGTYIRSIARDIGELLGCGAHLSSLRRTSVGAFTLSDAITLEALASAVENGRLEERLRQADEGVGGLAAAVLALSQVVLLRHGASVQTTDLAANSADVARIYDAAGSFAGLGSVAETGEIRGLKLLNL